MNWQIEVSSGAQKELKRFPRDRREQIKTVVDGLARNPFIGDIQKMKGETNTWRKRVGAYRIFYETYVAEKRIIIFRIERRGSKTY